MMEKIIFFQIGGEILKVLLLVLLLVLLKGLTPGAEGTLIFNLAP